MPESFARRMFKRMNDNYIQADQVDKTIREDVLPPLREAVDGNKEALKALDILVTSLNKYHGLFEAGTGHLEETSVILEGQKYDLAHLGTFIGAMKVYFAAEPVTIKEALDEFVLPVLQEVLVNDTSKTRFNELYEVFQRAKTLRYKKSKEAASET